MLSRLRAVALNPTGATAAATVPNPATPDVRATWDHDEDHDATRHAFDSLYDVLCELRDQQAELLRIMRRKDTVQRPITIGGTGVGTGGAPYVLRTEGYRHSRLFVGAAVTIIANDPVSTNLALTAGWNLLDLRDGCELTSANNVNALLELTDELVVR